MFAQGAAIGVERASLMGAVEMFGRLGDSSAVEGEALLDDAELLRRVYHLPHVVRVVFGRTAALRRRAGGCHREAHRAIVHPYAVADFAAEQLVHRRTYGLAGNVPQRHFIALTALPQA